MPDLEIQQNEEQLDDPTMDLDAIRTAVYSEDHSRRLLAMAALRHYSAEDAEPILLKALEHEEFIVRSHACMGLGRKRTSAGFAALCRRAQEDNDPNVRAEAASSLASFGFERCLPLLLELFAADYHWLVRRSIIAVVFECDDPSAQLAVAKLGLDDEDDTVRCSALELLAALVGSDRQREAEALLLAAVADSSSWIRRTVARVLAHFPSTAAHHARQRLRQDPDHRVVAATMEALLPVEPTQGLDGP